DGPTAVLEAGQGLVADDVAAGELDDRLEDGPERPLGEDPGDSLADLTLLAMGVEPLGEQRTGSRREVDEDRPLLDEGPGEGLVAGPDDDAAVEVAAMDDRSECECLEARFRHQGAPIAVLRQSFPRLGPG